MRIEIVRKKKSAVNSTTFLNRFLLIGMGLLPKYGAISSDVMKRIAVVTASHKLKSRKDKGKFTKPLLLAYITQLFCILCASKFCRWMRRIYCGTDP